MAVTKIRSVALIGAGRLAVNFALTLKQKGIPIIQVYNRTRKNGQKLARSISSHYIDYLDELTDQADLYALAVSDQALGEVAGRIRLKNQTVIHFSGTAPLSILNGVSSNTGVVYPPQSFTFGRKPGFLNIPLCVEASDRLVKERLARFAENFTGEVYHVTADQRRRIHLAAIFAGNFTNFMIAIAEDLLKNEGLPVSLIRPVIEKTRRNAMKGDVFSLQTGPAIREDYPTIREHIGSLSGMPEYREIYRLLSESIIQHKKPQPNEEL